MKEDGVGVKTDTVEDLKQLLREEEQRLRNAFAA